MDEIRAACTILAFWAMYDSRDAKPFWLPAAAESCLPALPEQGLADLFAVMLSCTKTKH